MHKGISDIKKIFIFFIVIAMVINVFLPAKVQAYSQSKKTGISAFPTEYQSALKKLSELHSNWTFTAFDTGMTWDEFMNKEMETHLRNTVHNSAESSWKCECGAVASGYACASREITAYYADPRNFLTESGIFQFLEMTYNPSVQTKDGVESIVKNTFMDKSVNTSAGQMRYSDIIMEAAKQTNISPYSIAIKIRQEIGVKETGSVSGKTPGYEGYYNFFNVGAYDGGDAIINGLKYAKEHGWNNQYTAIVEGARFLSDSYISVGQNTAYFYKFDVVDDRENGVCWHQYMTNIQDPSSQAKNLYNTYAKNNILNASLNFVIPVFRNMPGSSGLPGGIDGGNENSYFVSGTGVSLREGPTTGAKRLATLSLNEIVTVLEYNAGEADGYSWAHIERANGQKGYVANCYVTPCSGNSEGGSIAKIENSYIIARPDVKLSELLDKFSITSYEVKGTDGTHLDLTHNAATGNTIKNKIAGKTYTVVVLGDVNGDGEVDSADLLSLKRHLLGTKTITDVAKKLSADPNKDGTIDSADLLSVKKHLLGSKKISV